MKIRLYCSMFTLLLLSGLGLAQGSPQPPVEGSLSSPEVSVDFLLPEKTPDFSHYGFGGQLTASHFFSEHFGIQLQGDYLRTHGFNFHDMGVRVGPTIRFSTIHSIQPYAHALVGYSRVKASYINPATSYHSSGSLLGGVGVEFPLTGKLFGRVGADVQYDWTVRQRLGRGMVGIAYRFSARQGVAD